MKSATAGENAGGTATNEASDLALVFRPENEHVVQFGNRSVLVAAKSMALFEIDPVDAAVLAYGRAHPRCRLGELIEALAPGHSTERVLESVKRLSSFQVFVPERGGDGAWALRTVEAERFPLGSLVLNVSNKCNMHCTYCYEPDDAKYGSLAGNMDWETAKQSVDFLFERSQGSRDLNLVFFGGEALLNFKLMQEIASYARGRAEVEDRVVDFSVTTNGSLLTDEVIDFFRRYRFGVTVSLDGPKEIQDKRRRIGKSNGSYDVVVSRVRRLLERYTDRPIVARVTLTKGTLEIRRIYEHLTDLGFFEVGFGPVTARPNVEYGLDNADLDDLLAQFRDLGTTYVERALRNQHTGFTNLSTLLTDLHQGTNKLFPCGAGLGLLDVDGKGDVYLCHRFPGSEEHRYGNIREGVDYGRLNEFINQASVENKPVCQTCWIRGICGGGCYHEAYTTFGDGLLPNLHYCNWLRSWTEYGIGVYLRLEEENPGFIDQYVLRGRGDAPKELT